MQRFNIRWLGLLAITLIAIYLCWLIILPFIDVIIWSVVLAIVVYPLFLRVKRKIQSDTWASLATVLIVIVVALIPIALLVVSAASQVDDGVAMVKDGISKFKDFMGKDNWLANKLHPYVDPILYGQNNAATGSTTQPTTMAATATEQNGLADQLKSYAGVVVQRSVNVAGQILGVLVKIAFTLFTLFYLLRDAKQIGRAALHMLPLDEQQGQKVFERCREVVKASVQGVMVIAAIQGLLGGIAFACLGLPSSVLWGFVMFVCSLVPMAGSAIVWVPAAVYLAATGTWVKAIILVVIGGGVIGSIDNLLRPKLVGSKAGLHDLTIFFSVLGGLQAFGVAGLFVGPVVVALTLAIIEAFKQMNPVGPAKMQSTPKLLVTASDANAEPIEMVDVPADADGNPRPTIITPGQA